MAFSMKDHCALGNYFEMVLMEDANDMDIPDAVFFKLLQSTRSKNFSHFQKHFKEYVFRNMFYENNTKNQMTTSKKTLTFAATLSNSMRFVAYHKEKLPFHAFPSSTATHSISYVSKVTFKVNNRVFLNFEKRVYPAGAKAAPDSKKTASFNKIYINYNHDDNVDLSSVDTAINTCLQLVS
jgi:hypothetical protein